MNATAVIITGQPRTFAHCWKTQREAVFRKLENPYFFISFAPAVDDSQTTAIGDALGELWSYYPDRVHVEWVDQPEMPEEDRERFEAASFHAPYYRSVPVEGIWKQFWHLQRGWEFYVERGESAKFETFIRVRPDLHFHQFTPPAAPNYWKVRAGVYTPWWGSWGGLPDRFGFIVGQEEAKQYFNVFHRLNELLAEGCAYHPETMLARALERAGVLAFETLDAEFTTIRPKEVLNHPDPSKRKNHDAPVYTPRDWARVIGRLAEARD